MQQETGKYLKLVLSQDKTKCWVCNSVFTDSGGLEAVRNEHHIVPRANGGLHGPTVMLCSECHDTLHQIATNLMSANSLKSLRDLAKAETLLLSLNIGLLGNKEFMRWLVSRVVVSTLIVADDPNKKTTISFPLTAKDQERLDALKKILSLRSREAVVKFLINKAYDSYFK